MQITIGTIPGIVEQIEIADKSTLFDALVIPVQGKCLLDFLYTHRGFLLLNGRTVSPKDFLVMLVENSILYGTRPHSSFGPDGCRKHFGPDWQNPHNIV